MLRRSATTDATWESSLCKPGAVYQNKKNGECDEEDVFDRQITKCDGILGRGMCWTTASGSIANNCGITSLSKEGKFLDFCAVKKVPRINISAE